MEYLNTILLTIITLVITGIFFFIKKSVNKHLNRIDLNEWKTSSINYGCEQTIGEKYKEARDEKWDNTVEADELKNKSR